MIFDNRECTQLYLDYVERGDVTAISKLIESSESLIKVMAAKFITNGDQDWFDELVQIGRIVVYDVVRNKKFDPQKGKLHSLLSTSIPNKMIDAMRKVRIEPGEFCLEDVLERDSYHQLPSGLWRNGDSDDEIAEFRQRTIDYAHRRFPSYHQAQYAAGYVCEILMNHYSRPHITATLTTVYDCPHSQQFHRSIRCHYAGMLRHIPLHEAEAIASVSQNNEWTRQPDVVLIYGTDIRHYLMNCLL